MKILQINKYYYRRRGAETYFLDLIDLLESKGHEVAVFSMQHPENLPSKYSQYFVENMELGKNAPRRVPTMQKIKTAKNIIWNTSAQEKLEQLLQEFKPDIAHIHNIYHQLSPSILSTLRKHNIPIVQTLHDYKLICPNYSLFTEGKTCERCRGHKYYNAVTHCCVQQSRSASAVAMVEMYVHKWLRIYEKSIKCFISPSQFLAQTIDKWGEHISSIAVLPNFVYLQKTEPSFEPGEYLLYAGALTREKGVDLLLDNYAKNSYDLPLFVAGSGPLITQVQKTPNVKYLGQLNSTELQRVVSKAVAVVVPARYYENYPYSVLEAFAVGKPVLGANIGGIPEQVIPGETGWLFEAGNAESLDKGIRAITNNIAAAQTLGRTAYAWVKRQADADQHYQKLYDIYQRYT